MPHRILFANLLVAATILAEAGPPYISRGGVVNAASRLAPPLPGSPIAPGSLFSIRGVRLGPAAGVRGGPSAGVLVELIAGTRRESATVLYADESRVLALMPKSVEPGDANLVVTYARQSSAPYSLRIKPNALGIFARQPKPFIELPDGLREPPPIMSGRGKTIFLEGTGLGLALPPDLEVRIGGRRAGKVWIPPVPSEFPGADLLAFEVPAEAPLGCQVPIVVRTGGTWSNTITATLAAPLAGFPTGRPCRDDEAWVSQVLAFPGATGTVLLLRFLFHADVGNGKEVSRQWDSALADFSRSSETAAGPRFFLPPAGTCTSFHGLVELGGFLNPPLPGEVVSPAPDGVTSSSILRNPFHLPIARHLDAGPYLTIRGRQGEKRLERDPQLPDSYLTHIGGELPAPGRAAMSMFLNPGKFDIVSGGGKDVGPFTSIASMPAPIEWTNRLETRQITRSLGVTVKWRQRGGAKRLMAVIAGAADRVSGAGGLCICVAAAGSGSFTIPPETLANLPATDASEDPGRPVTGLVLVSLPGRPAPGFRAEGLDAGNAIAGFVTGQPVSYR